MSSNLACVTTKLYAKPVYLAFLIANRTCFCLFRNRTKQDVFEKPGSLLLNNKLCLRESRRLRTPLDPLCEWDNNCAGKHACTCTSYNFVLITYAAKMLN
jgi:hypothetical protein